MVVPWLFILRLIVFILVFVLIPLIARFALNSLVGILLTIQWIKFFLFNWFNRQILPRRRQICYIWFVVCLIFLCVSIHHICYQTPLSLSPIVINILIIEAQHFLQEIVIPISFQWLTQILIQGLRLLGLYSNLLLGLNLLRYLVTLIILIETLNLVLNLPLTLHYLLAKCEDGGLVELRFRLFTRERVIPFLLFSIWAWRFDLLSNLFATPLSHEILSLNWF